MINLLIIKTLLGINGITSRSNFSKFNIFTCIFAHAIEVSVNFSISKLLCQSLVFSKLEYVPEGWIQFFQKLFPLLLFWRWWRGASNLSKSSCRPSARLRSDDCWGQSLWEVFFYDKVAMFAVMLLFEVTQTIPGISHIE